MLIKKDIIIRNKSGLHARPAALFVQVANKYESTVKIIKDEQEVNGKSIMGILMLAAEKGSKVTLIVDGVDAEKALEEFIKILVSEE